MCSVAAQQQETERLQREHVGIKQHNRALVSFVSSQELAYHILVCQVLYFLSGLTCDDQTFIVKSNAQRKASEHGIALVTCDTSPRGLNIDGEEEDWDFGTGAGFYLNATQSKWKQYRMYDYVVKELPEVLQSLAGLDVHKVGRSAECQKPAISQVLRASINVPIQSKLSFLAWGALCHLTLSPLLFSVS